MVNDPAPRPGDDDNDPSGEPQNPFKGTPFEQLFSAFGGAGAGGAGGGAGIPGFGAFGTPGAGGMPDLSALLGQMQQLLQPHDGAVNWNLAQDLARRGVADSPDPSVGAAETARIADALQLADVWLDAVTDLPSGVTSAAGWSRAEWIEQTLPVWKKLVEPVAEHVVAAMGNALPAEAKAMAGPLIGLLGQAGSAMFGSQVGQALAGLAAEVLSSSDIGLPLAPVGKAALLPTNITAFADGLDVPADDVRLYLAIREAAHQRLFAHVPWLNAHLLAAVEDFGRGTTIDVAGMESKMSGLDPTNPAAIQEALAGGLFEPEKTPTQQAALVRLETILALVEGWVDEVVSQATVDRMPNAAKLQEIVRRRRAAGGPAEDAFAALVGLEMRPRRLRDAATLWGSLRSRRGAEARDAIWAHPDLLPTASDLDDPLGFGENPELEEAANSFDDDFDAALAELLDEEGGRGKRDDTDGTDGTDGSGGADGSGEDPGPGDAPRPA
ncbi:zinc-dependent metalloprotease [Nocardioides sp. HDW12B]|uniref:zinc-dependent metalloprotease n=1 Tax=Nocardioides sp. HDW12B TaxID=2714939 RepID=UPI00140DC457|nr:zinc-dependent metalloprotease [Nocardioides sp. HDW12B]QIK67392.1 zinc-dependent metalloprotease [Nocardioides sp. HDW12B]